MSNLYRSISVFILALLCIGLIYFAYLQLSASIYASAVTKSSVKLQHSDDGNMVEVSNLASSMSQKLLRNPLITAEQLIQVHQLSAWIDYTNQLSSEEGLSVSDTSPLLQLSRELRPTWPYTYVMQGQLASSQQQKSELLALAEHFGPSNPQVNLHKVLLGFERWDSLSTQDQSELASEALRIANNHKQKVELNNQLLYAPARARICNLLRFNQINLDNCQT